jgi:general secretion pathway protein E
MKVKVGGDELDLRVSVLPSIYGETVNIRLLNSVVHFLDLAKLGLAKEDLHTVEQVISKPHGMILLTGPTGSGKTTTLYASLKKIRSDETKIITLEDPIEYRLDGITQIQVLPKIGLTFARGLRSLLRHDPDVMMVGEIRDGETAKIAVQSALTGHLVFSTLHTNDAASAITRLADLGVEPFLIASTVECVIAQRLVRTICSDCKQERPLDRTLIDQSWLKSTKLPDTVWEGTGCDTCSHTGYRGRTGVFEVLRIDADLRENMVGATHSRRIKELARKNGMKTLLEDGLRKVSQGVTTLTEIVRVTHEEELDS